MPTPSGFDIIGDIHGHADKLTALLQALGYRDTQGAYRHTDRQAIFVGDYVDRGPKQVEAVSIVRRMVDAGSAQAIMGNHEFNALAWATADPDEAGAYLRPRSGEVGTKNRKQHSAFLAEVEGTPQHADIAEWMWTLPLWLDLGAIRVVHACWHDGMVQCLRPLLASGERLTPALLVQGSRKGTPEYEAIETLLKGEEVGLPAGIAFLDKDGHARHEVRTRWWVQQPRSFAEVALAPPDALQQWGDHVPLPASLLRYTSTVPTFFGHYWMSGTPRRQSPTVACVDYSVGKGGALVAYRWSGEEVLSDSNFVAV